MNADKVYRLVARLNKLHATIQTAKAAHPELKVGFGQNFGSILNAYREGDISFAEAVKACDDIAEHQKT